jgi:mannose-6-phosphate isomerase
MANEMLALFFDKFLDPATGTLGEFFDDNLSPHPSEGHVVEAGHHAEWIWLLKCYQDASGATDPRIATTMSALFTWVKTHGIDKKYGGIFNAQNRQGGIIDGNKRIWCQFETLRAASIMAHFPEHKKDAQEIIKNLTEIIEDHYIDAKTGAWEEILNQNLSPKTDYLPATTPYHIYPALREILER